MAKDTVILERRYVPKGTLIIKEGEEGNCAYLVQSGRVCVFTHNDDQRIELAHLGVGEIFGELALIFDESRSASVVADEDCNLIVITRLTLTEKLQRSDPTISALVHMLTKRILSVNNTLVTKQSSIDDLSDTSRIIYQNIHSSLPRSQQSDFQKTVLPKLDGFLEAVRDFQSKNSET